MSKTNLISFLIRFVTQISNLNVVQPQERVGAFHYVVYGNAIQPQERAGGFHYVVYGSMYHTYL